MKIEGLLKKNIVFELIDKDGNTEFVDDFYWFEQNSFHNNEEGSLYDGFKIRSIGVTECLAEVE